jgi:glucokinase
MDSEANFLGFDIGGTQVRAALAKGNQIVASQSAQWPQGLSPADEVEFIASLASDLMSQMGVTDSVCAAGVSLAALVDQDGNVVHWPNRPTWRGLAFQSLLQARLAVPTVVEDDANAAALAEWTFGAGRGYRHVLVMLVGTGVGAGLILDGRLFRGEHGWAGELGHLVMLADGPACPCGHRGCLQMMASGRALERVAAERGLPGAPAVTAAAERDEAWALAALAECGRWLGLAAANVVNLLDLDGVVVGGGLSRLGPPWWSSLEETLRANLLNPTYRRVALHRAALPDTAGLLGALSLAWQKVGLKNPAPVSEIATTHEVRS